MSSVAEAVFILVHPVGVFITITFAEELELFLFFAQQKN